MQGLGSICLVWDNVLDNVRIEAKPASKHTGELLTRYGSRMSAPYTKAAPSANPIETGTNAHSPSWSKLLSTNWVKERTIHIKSRLARSCDQAAAKRSQ